MDTPDTATPVAPDRKRRSALTVYTIALTVVVLGFLGWYIWRNFPTATCPMPKTIQYSYDDPRDYLGPFLSAMTSHDSRIVRRYYVPKISSQDRTTIEGAMDSYRSVRLEVGTYGSDYATTDVGYNGASGSSFTRLTWLTKKVDGCWRVQRVDEQALTIP